MLLDRRKEVFESRRVGWKSGKAARSGVKVSSSSSRAPTASPRRGGADGALFEVCEAPTDSLRMRETTHLHIYLERGRYVNVQRRPCVTFFSTNHPFLIPPDVYRDGYYLDPLMLFVGALSSSSPLFIFSCICIDRTTSYPCSKCIQRLFFAKSTYHGDGTDSLTTCVFSVLRSRRRR